MPEPWARWRDALGALHPAYYRLVLDWPSLQPRADAAADLDAPNAGCMRTVPPCLGWTGVRDQLRALASRQREGGWTGVAVITGTPGWAASAPSGCERRDTPARARAPRADALPAYRRLVADVLAAAREAGARLPYWSPWNEPNHPAFLSPQRPRCDAGAAPASPAAYVELARALQAELAVQPGEHRLVLGETAGLMKAGPRSTAAPEFAAALPRDLVCSAAVWAQHGYIGGPDPVPAVGAALGRAGCAEALPLWITETGTGAAPRALSAARAQADAARGCRALHDRLARWWADPRVSAAFQYTLREDDRFATGLVSTDLTRARPALDEWSAWAARPSPAAPPPADGCGA